MKDKKKLQDILAAIEAIEAYSVSSYDKFLSDSKTQDAILYNLIIIGEAANKISEEFKQSHNEIPWGEIIGMRHILVHGYFDIDLDIVWVAIEDHLPVLREKVKKLVQ